MASAAARPTVTVFEGAKTVGSIPLPGELSVASSPAVLTRAAR